MLLIFLCAVSAAWQWTPLKYWSDPRKMLQMFKLFSTSFTAPMVVIAAYMIGGLVMFPIVVLIPVTALMFGSVLGPVYAMAGCLASALICYVLGKFIGYETVTRFGGMRIQYLARRFVKQGFLTITTLRLLPVAPYTIINLIAGAFRISLCDYVFGTMVGLLPGIVIMTVLESRAEKALINPDMENLFILGVIFLLLLIAVVWLRKWMRASAIK